MLHLYLAHIVLDIYIYIYKGRVYGAVYHCWSLLVAAALPYTEYSIVSTHHMCSTQSSDLPQQNSTQTRVSTFPRSIFGSIRPLSACLWYPNVPGGDGHGTVHISRVHHLLEILLPLVWRSVCYCAICNADKNTDAQQPVFHHFAWMKSKCQLRAAILARWCHLPLVRERNSAATHEVQPYLYCIKN